MKKLFKLLFFTLFVSLSFSLNALAKETRFVFISDINLSDRNAYQLQETIKEINDLKDVDFIVFGGNNIAKANIRNLDLFTYLLRKTNKKSYVLLGSNDVLSSSGITKKYYLKRIKRALWYRHSSKPNYTFKKRGVLFVVMDGTKQYFQSPNGYYSKEELSWLKKVLDKNQDKNIVILQHFPLLSTKTKWEETYDTKDYEELLFKYSNIKAIVSGHYNLNQEIKKDNIVHILTKSYSKTGSYKVIEFDFEKDFIATYVVK